MQKKDLKWSRKYLIRFLFRLISLEINVTLIWIRHRKFHCRHVLYSFAGEGNRYSRIGYTTLIVAVKLFHAFSHVFSKRFSRRMHSCTDCICLAFPHCAFSNGSSNGLPERMHIHTGCIYMIYLHCAFSNVSSNGLPESMHIRTGGIYMIFHRCVFSNGSSNGLPQRMHSHTDNI